MEGRKKITKALQIFLFLLGLFALVISTICFVSFVDLEVNATGAEALGFFVFVAVMLYAYPATFIIGSLVTLIAGLQRRREATKDKFSLFNLIAGIAFMALPIIYFFIAYVIPLLTK